jgi:flagellar hook-associated protein 2
MSTITFGGLATGLDTGSLIDELMAAERQPLTLLENDKTWLNNRLTALQQFDAKLNSFQVRAESLGSSESISARQVTQTSNEYFSGKASADALLSNYQVEVVSLARVQKDASQGYADKTALEFGTGNLTLAVGENDPVTIEMTSENNSLEGLMAAINDTDAGVTASIINDGTDAPYRLVLTGDDVAADFSFDTSGLSGGTYEMPVFATTQSASQAHIRVDNVDIFAASNTLTEAVPGVTLDLIAAEEGVTTGLGVALDKTSITQKITSFVSGYNSVISAISESSEGALGSDSGLNSIKRRLQNMLSERIPNSGNFTSLAQLGLETQRDGTLTLNEDVLSDAIGSDFDSVAKLFTGEGEVEGIGTRFTSYLERLTDSGDGFLAGRKESINNNIGRIDKRIEMTEMRLEKREQTLTNQFTALEMLVSELNTTGDYLTKQMESLENMWNYNK